ncbi:MAG: choice-of-anchor L domain-containing protein, partial [Pirellulales bacterium]
VLVNNVFRNNQGAAISINVNALRSDFVPDWGRSRGIIDTFDQFNDNRGPLVRLNRIGNISGNAAINGMLVRGGTLNVESVWDDADIVHVLLNEVAVPNFHTFGGLRLQSSPTQSLVVKLRGDDAGFTATGTPLDINDRIGGSIQIVGAPGRPVVLTAIADDSVGAGLTPDGQPQEDTNNDGDSDVPGDSGPVFPPSGGELTVTTTTDAMTLVNGMLLRPLASGVTINSATYTGGTIAAGTYINGDGVPLEILQVGTIITTGDANLPTSNTSPGFTGIMGTAGDADLDALIAGTGFTTEEAAILTITFTVDPASGLKSGRFNFQFGSDEFSEFVGSPVNDVLGGFINGGPLTNFMRDSQGNLVSINSALFDLDNETAPFLDIEYDGMTSGLLAQFPVQPGLNTLKIAIADVSDAILDSGILMTDLRFSQQEVGSGGVGRAAPESGTWRSVRLDKFSNDRNVAVVNEMEPAYTGGLGTNDAPATAQALGELAPDEKSGDDNRRLGFEVHGFVSLNDPGDVDVYSFKARAGTEVWLDIDRTSHALDTVLELVDANGNVLARSNDSVNETAASLAALLPGNLARVMQRDVYLNDVYGSADLRDFYTTNPRDAGMRLVLPGPLTNVPNTYYVRVRSNSSNLNVLTGGQSQGAYQLQLRLRELDEVPGSTVRHADIRFATNGIEILGMPAHSPLLAESAETTAGHGTLGTAQDLGNLLTSDRNTLGVGGVLDSAAQVDWYSFTVDYDLIQAVGGFNAAAKTWSTIFDIDY